MLQPDPATVAEGAHLLGGAALALPFALLTRRRLGAMLLVVRAQSDVAAAAAAWQAWAAASGVLAALAVAVLLGGAVALPWLLRRQAEAAAEGPVDAPPVPAAMTAAAALVVLAILAVLPAHLPGLPPLRENLGLALSAVLVALLVLPTRRAALPQLVGLLALANGVALAAIAAGTYLAVPLAIAVVALFGIVAAGLAALPGDAA